METPTRPCPSYSCPVAPALQSNYSGTGGALTPDLALVDVSGLKDQFVKDVARLLVLSGDASWV